MRTALTIAGSDSGGGAGIQADLKSFAAIGVHGTSVVTCVTAQNTRAVTSIFPLPTQEVLAQLDAVLEDFEVRAAKTGMLYSAQIVHTVARALDRAAFPLVVDPVMVATVGARLDQDDFRDALVGKLLPMATLVTPNRHEAERLAGHPIGGIEDMERAAREIRKLGAEAVLVKGGHVAGELVDVLFNGTRMRRLRGFRYAKELHGAGCALAASVAGYLALGRSLPAAVNAARRRVASGFLSSYRVGGGVEVIDSQVRPDRYTIWGDLTDALQRLRILLPNGIPRAGIRAAFALPGAMAAGDVCAGNLRGDPASFGADRRAAEIVLEALRHDPRARAAIALRVRTGNARRLGSAGLSVAQVHGVSAADLRRAIMEIGRVPDAVVGAGTRNGETGMWVLGRSPRDALRKLRRILRG